MERSAQKAPPHVVRKLLGWVEMKTKPSEAVAFLEDLAGGPLTFGSFLRAIREGEGMTLAQFAEPLGISRQKLCDVEKGRRTLNPGRAAEWALVLGYSETQFVRLIFQDQLRKAGLELRVSVDAA